MDYPIPTLEHLGWTLIVYKVYYQGYQFLVMTFVWAGGGPDNLSALKSGSGSGLGLGLCHHTHDRRKKGIEISVESRNPLSCEKREIACIVVERNNLPQWVG